MSIARIVDRAAIVALVVMTAASVLAADPPVHLAERGKLLFADDFERKDLGEAWRLSVKSFWIDDGAMFAATRDDATHPAVSRTSVPLKDAVVSFRFKFEGGPRFTVVFNDKAYEGSHAGHICRASIGPGSVQLGDDKEGPMKNEIYALWKGPKTRPQAEPLVVGRSTKAPVKLDPAEWHSATVEIVGDEMLLSVDDKPTAYLKSSGIAHPTKSEWGFTASGKAYRFDDVKVWEARANPDWPARRESLLRSLPKSP